MEINQREIWFVKFPLEEDSSKILQRPVVVISVSDDKMKILSVKVTKHEARDWDDYDTTIKEWIAAGLRFPSTARVSKIRVLPRRNFLFKIGDIHPDDWDMLTDKIQDFRESQR